MCMDTPQEKPQRSGRTPSFNQTSEASPPATGADAASSSETSPTSHDDYHEIVEFGPLKIKQRKKPAPTLATGRRSKYETLSPEEEHKRNIRRERNRAAAERVRLSRLSIEQQLQGQIDTLQDEEERLLNNVQELRYRKLQLETRIFTDGPTCSSMTLRNPQSAFNSNPIDPPFIRQATSLSNDYFDDLFPESPPPVENNYSHSFTTVIPDDIDDFIMNP